MPRPDTTGRLAEVAAALRGEGVEVVREDVEASGRDETEAYFERPGLGARPRTTGEVAAVLRLADEAEIPVTPRGGGTGKSAAAIPVSGGIVLTVERMDRIEEIDAKNRFAVVQPGVILQRLHEALAPHALQYPVDMSSRGSCMVGGNLATNAGGERAVKYGVTRDQVRGVEAVLMGGQVIRTGGKTSKNSAGYALHHLLVGSEGTLGVITEATLRLLPLPPYRKTLLAPFDSLEKAADAALAVEAAGVDPSALELVERAAAALSEEMLGQKLPHADAAGLLLVEVEGFRERRTEEARDRAAEVLLQNGADDVMVAPREKVWRVRHAIAEAVKRLPAYTS
ncbi:MAG: FAD-binding oxidoreductase, partial [Planctomycetota bacterium]